MQPTVAGTIFKIKKFALHDGPGIRTTVFFKGCPLTCRWCHNPEGQLPDPQPMRRRVENEDGTHGHVTETAGWRVDSRQLVAELEKDRIFWDESGGGVTISGGEPLGQPAFLLALLSRCREREIHTALDTSGYAPWETMEEILKLVDLFLYDLKVVDDGIHRRTTGVSNRQILDNLSRIAAAGGTIRIRVPMVPGVNDSDQQIRELLAVLAPLAGIESVDLLPFHPIADAKYRRLDMENPMKGDDSMAAAAIDPVRTRIQACGYRVRVGG